MFGSRTGSGEWTTVLYDNIFYLDPGCSFLPAFACLCIRVWEWGGLCSCVDSERGTLTYIVLVLQGLISQCMPAVIIIWFLSLRWLTYVLYSFDSAILASIMPTFWTTRTRSICLAFATAINGVHFLCASEDARGGIEEYSADVGFIKTIGILTSHFLLGRPCCPILYPCLV